MASFEKKLYDFEAVPPEQIWDNIREELHDEKVIDLYNRKKSKTYYFAIAAASLVIIFIGSYFIKIKDIKKTNSGVATNQAISPEKMKDSMMINQKILESIIHNPKEKQEIVANDLSAIHLPKKYITVAGPEGQPVKISPKAATLIIAADNEFPPKPVWSKKISKWQKIMLSSTVSPTSAGLADLIEIASVNDKIE